MRFRPLGLCALALAVLAVPALSNETHEIQVTETEFDPASITINRDDVVKFVWVSGSHAILNGETPTSEDAGKIFEFTLGKENPEVEITFSEVGEFPFFSEARFETMSGVITVHEVTPVDIKTWGWIKQAFEGDNIPR